MRGRVSPIKVHAFYPSALSLEPWIFHAGEGFTYLSLRIWFSDFFIWALLYRPPPSCLQYSMQGKDSPIKRFTHFILRLCYLDFRLPCILQIWFFGFATWFLEYAVVLILFAFGISCGRKRQPIRLFHHHWFSLFTIDTSRGGEFHASDTSALLLGLWTISGSHSSYLRYPIAGEI